MKNVVWWCNACIRVNVTVLRFIIGVIVNNFVWPPLRRHWRNERVIYEKQSTSHLTPIGQTHTNRCIGDTSAWWQRIVIGHIYILARCQKLKVIQKNFLLLWNTISVPLFQVKIQINFIMLCMRFRNHIYGRQLYYLLHLQYTVFREKGTVSDTVKRLRYLWCQSNSLVYTDIAYGNTKHFEILENVSKFQIRFGSSCGPVIAVENIEVHWIKRMRMVVVVYYGLNIGAQ